MMPMTTDIIQFHHSIDALIEGWLYEKQSIKSGSAKTATAYRDTLTSFRRTLQQGGLDLDTDDIPTLVRVAGMWASQRAQSAKRTGDVSATTYNLRLAILSSFYTYYQEQARLYNAEIVNPIPLVKKRKVQAYAGAQPLDGDDTTARLAALDVSTTKGKRDYLLLSIALTTGRRGSELVNLRWRDVRVAGKKVTLTFAAKGGKVMRDTLDSALGKLFLEYLHEIYGAQLGSDPDAPLWVSFSKQNAGQPITIHTLYDLCEQVLGVSKTHALRHTFAVEMDNLHAPLSEISARLGHTDEKITSLYLKQARSAENPYTGRLAARFGIGSRTSPQAD